MSEHPIFNNPALKPSIQIHYKQEMNRTQALFNPPSDKPNFISARHDDHCNDFERNWVSLMEKIV